MISTHIQIVCKIAASTRREGGVRAAGRGAKLPLAKRGAYPVYWYYLRVGLSPPSGVPAAGRDKKAGVKAC